MSKKATWPPVPKLHTNGQLRIKWRGKSYYLGRPGSPGLDVNLKTLLERLEQAEKAKQDEPEAPAAFASTSVAEAVLRWQEEALPSHTPKERENYRRALCPLVRVCGHLEAARFGADELEDVRDQMVSGEWLTARERAGKPGQGKRGRAGPWCRKNANRAVRRIRDVWRWLVRKKVVPRGAYAELLTVRALRRGAVGTHEAPRRPDVSHDDVLRVAGAIKRSCAGRMLAVQLWAGMRSGEVRLMEWPEIDQSGPVWIFRPAKHKLSRLGIERVIFLGPEAQAVLREQRKAEPRSRVVFLSRHRGKAAPYTAQNYARVVARAGRRAGLARCRPYWSRHACRDRVTTLHGAEAARAILGHASIEQTLKYGAALDVPLATRAALGAG